MIGEILSTGDEVRTGAIVDSNAAYLAQRLEEQGIEVVRHTCVGDDRRQIISALNEISRRSDIAIVTGGLGPTTDDLTSECAAKAAGVELMEDPLAFRCLENFFKTRNRPISASNRKQAFIPKGSECLDNPVGTAAGFMLRIGECWFFFLPGVPHEMERMFAEQVVVRLQKILGTERRFIQVKTLSTFGLPESAAGDRVADVEARFPGVRLGLRAKFPEIQVKLYASGNDQTTLNRLMDDAACWVMTQLGDYVLSPDGLPMEAVIGDLLRKQNASIAVAESCTGGLIAHLLTNVSGSSDYFLLSGVTYSNDSKIKVLGVSPSTLERYGAVHEETAKEMAEGIRRISGATYGLSTSGIAGPTGGTPDKPVGTVCIGIATPNSLKGYRFHFAYSQRMMNKQIFAMTAMDLLRKELIHK